MKEYGGIYNEIYHCKYFNLIDMSKCILKII